MIKVGDKVKIMRIISDSGQELDLETNVSSELWELIQAKNIFTVREIRKEWIYIKECEFQLRFNEIELINKPSFVTISYSLKECEQRLLDNGFERLLNERKEGLSKENIYEFTIPTTARRYFINPRQRVLENGWVTFDMESTPQWVSYNVTTTATTEQE